jgi:hypothetical protein
MKAHYWDIGRIGTPQLDALPGRRMGHLSNHKVYFANDVFKVYVYIVRLVRQKDLMVSV